MEADLLAVCSPLDESSERGTPVMVSSTQKRSPIRSTDVVRIVSERVVLVGTALQVELHLADDVAPFAVLAEVESAHPQDDERTVYTLRLGELGVAEERRLVERALQIEREQRP